MGIELPNSGGMFFPEIPEKVKTVSPELYEYLLTLKRKLDELAQGAFDNTYTVSTAFNSAVSGTFTISSGGSIIISSGIVISVTS